MIDNNPLYIASLEKAFKVLEAFDTHNKSFSFTELTQRSGLNKSAAQRYIYTLEALGYIEKDNNNKRYQLTIKNLLPASAFLSQNELIHRTSPYIVRLREKFNARFGLSVLWQQRIIYLIELHSHHEVYSTDYPGFSVPVYCTTSGRMFLSQLNNNDIVTQLQQMQRKKRTPTTKTEIQDIMAQIEITRENGYCTTDEEYKIGHINVAAPIYKGDEIVACIVAVLQKSEWTHDSMYKTVLPELLESSRVISQHTGG